MLEWDRALFIVSYIVLNRKSLWEDVEAAFYVTDLTNSI